MSDVDGLCVVSHPLGDASESHARTLLNVLSTVTTVSLVAVTISEASSLRTEYETVDITEETTTDSVLLAAFQFLFNQIRMARIIYHRPETSVLFFGVTSYLIPILTAKLVGKKTILQPRGDVPLTLRLQWEQRMPAPVARLLAGSVGLLEEVGFRVSNAIITYTPSMAEELGLTRFDQKLYAHGARYVTLDRFYSRKPFEQRERKIGFLGRLDEEKGIRTLTQVAQQLPSDVTFRFIGDGELRDWVERELADEIVTGDVEITGWVDHEDVPAELSSLQLLVMPSAATEGLPTTILEAMACGTPVYATPVSGIPSVIHEGETGFLMHDTDPVQIADDIVSILDWDDLGTISDDIRILIENEYSFEAAVERYRSILSEISSG